MHILIALLLLCASSAYAQTSEEAKEQLSGTLSAIQSSSKKQKALEEKQAKLAQEMEKLQQETVELARDTKEQEESLGALEEKTGILEDQKKDKIAALEARKAELSEVLSAMVKLGKMPPEAVIAMPGKLQETLSAARALGVVSKAVEEEANSLKAQLRELDVLEQKITSNRDALEHKKETLEARKKQLAGKINERSKVHTALGGKAQEEKERIAHLTEKSKTLQDLVDTLGRTERSNPSPVSERQQTGYFTRGKQHKPRSFQQAKGKLSLPVSGKIVGLYGHSQEGAAFSKGVMIEARSSSSVVAPYDGEVVFAGLFRDYGKMVIIRHSGDYHLLLSGMSEINCTPGQRVLEGEPVGTMGRSGSDKSRLYMEMRKGGKPIDPMEWFRD